jgi:D-beta-D-heptose 7-phosphate kinase/D-beta-D-heptose 1-phosphate adenosyltransferase
VSNFLSLLANKKPTILVAGDLILDRYIWGDVERISPEAPVQVLKWKKEQETLGGATNVANNLASLGCNVRVLGLIGDDAEGECLENLALEAGLEVHFIQRTVGRATVTKTRFIGRSQQILRVDREEDTAISIEYQNSLLDALPDALEGVDGIICSDYLKGALSPTFMETLVTVAEKRSLLIVADPKGSTYSKYNGVTAITPNLAEVSLATGMLLNSEEEIDRAACALFSSLACDLILITRGPKGMTLFEKDGRLANEPANPLEVYDVTGAGDTVTALFGLSLIQGILPAEAAHVANIGAGVVVGKMGTATVSLQEMEAALSGGGERKVLSRSDVFNCLQAERAKGRQVVFTNGCFDLLHVGHIQYLQQARNLGDLLVVGLNDDASVGRVKGEGRPLIEERQRAELLAALMCVDYVVYFPEDTPDELIRALRPDILVKGGDYSRDQVAGRSFVESYGGRVEVLPFVDGVSTTKIVKTIIERYSGCTDQK